MPQKKWATKRITVNLSPQEREQLEEIQKRTGRAITDIVRESVRDFYQKTIPRS
jgi:hypothetical protein